MQRVTNCILIENQKALLIKKPRRGWYAIPGGKMEQGETLKESVIREFGEETDLFLTNPSLIGAFTFNIFSGKTCIQEWMMFTFICRSYTGTLTSQCVEGELEWVPLDEIISLPMAEGDRSIFNHIFTSDDILYASFSYTSEYELINKNLNPTVR
ncbi:MAG TPA: 8-oxo-dGTP diphosphatase [Bacillota bacterium]|nr:8-oxo-dGTP diphosphatase [Bacillota bacterium]